jgi:hypothetical protein
MEGDSEALSVERAGGPVDSCFPGLNPLSAFFPALFTLAGMSLSPGPGPATSSTPFCNEADTADTKRTRRGSQPRITPLERKKKKETYLVRNLVDVNHLRWRMGGR